MSALNITKNFNEEVINSEKQCYWISGQAGAVLAEWSVQL